MLSEHMSRQRQGFLRGSHKLGRVDPANSLRNIASVEEHRSEVGEALQKYLFTTGALSATAMQDDWFPSVRADIFISHSHQDESLAMNLAAWLRKELQLVAFVDSAVWGHADRLLKLLDQEYCYDLVSKTYSYEKRNLTTSHVHMMLQVALAQMIDRTECLFFLNTPRSILSKEIVGDGVQRTKSPWLFSELALVQFLRRRKRREHSGVKESVRQGSINDSVNILYKVEMSHLLELVPERLEDWRAAWRADQTAHPLDLLYRQLPPTDSLVEG